MSNSLLTSNTAIYVCVPVSKEEKRPCMVVRSYVSHEKPNLKCWLRSSWLRGPYKRGLLLYI